VQLVSGANPLRRKVRAAFVGAGDRVAHAGMSLAGAFRRTGAAFRRGF
jgi:hypothetical protein